MFERIVAAFKASSWRPHDDRKALELASQKREMERALRAAGHSRASAMKAVAAHFKTPCKDYHDLSQ